MSQPNTDNQTQYYGGNLHDLHGHREYSNQPYPGYNNDLLSQPLRATPIPPLASNAYLHPSSGSSQLHNSLNETSDSSVDIPLVQHTSWDSGAQSVSQTRSTNFQQTAGGTSASVPKASSMRHHPSDLPVLGVEQYGSGRSAKRPAAKANIKTKTTAIPSDTTRISKKRGRRRTEAEQTDSAEEPKRTRGRPRLETKDQTPTEVSGPLYLCLPSMFVLVGLSKTHGFAKLYAE